MPNHFIQFETRAGDPILAGDNKLIPFARALRLQAPGFPGGLIWNRPVSVVAVDAEGKEQVLPVQDVTRQAQIALLGIGFAGSLLIWLVFRLLRKDKEQI